MTMTLSWKAGGFVHQAAPLVKPRHTTTAARLRLLPASNLEGLRPPLPHSANVALWTLPFCFALLISHSPAPALADGESKRVSPPASVQRYEPLSQPEKEASDAFRHRVDSALSWLEKGKRAQSEGDFKEALRWYTQITEKDGDLALAEYARVGRAISLYEVGDRDQAFVELEDVSVTLKGYPEVHAALAAVLYVEKHSLGAAEQQFSIATMLNPRFADLSYVKDNRQWPPSLIESLEKFLNLQ